jgi:hypothetical protein
MFEQNLEEFKSITIVAHWAEAQLAGPSRRPLAAHASRVWPRHVQSVRVQCALARGHHGQAADMARCSIARQSILGDTVFDKAIPTTPATSCYTKI